MSDSMRKGLGEQAQEKSKLTLLGLLKYKILITYSDPRLPEVHHGQGLRDLHWSW